MRKEGILTRLARLSINPFRPALRRAAGVSSRNTVSANGNAAPAGSLLARIEAFFAHAATCEPAWPGGKALGW